MLVAAAGPCAVAQVLTNPTYMEDHLGVLDEEVAAGAVPLPQLPAHKQVGGCWLTEQSAHGCYQMHLAKHLHNLLDGVRFRLIVRCPTAAVMDMRMQYAVLLTGWALQTGV